MRRRSSGGLESKVAITAQGLGRFAVALALCAAFVGWSAGAAEARVFVGIGVPFPGFYPAPYYYPPPPVYYAPPPPVVYAPPQTYAPAPQASGGGQTCYAGAYVCPMDRPTATGS